MNGQIGLVSGWNTLLAGVPAGFIQAANYAGIILILGSIGLWWWKRHKQGGQGMSGFPIWGVGIGGLLVAPGLLVPALLALIQVVILLFAQLISFIAGLF